LLDAIIDVVIAEVTLLQFILRLHVALGNWRGRQLSVVKRSSDACRYPLPDKKLKTRDRWRTESLYAGEF